MNMDLFIYFLLVNFISLFPDVCGGSEKIRLTDINVLTLYNGKMTTYRRTSPVLQLNCVGGSAGCQFKPQVVQCYNRGSDGFDVQWECKADMDNSYRFGRIEVVCEGYDYPEDKYVLRGSCGLEYTIDVTKGHGQNQHHSYYNKESQYHSYMPSFKKSSSGFGDLLVLAVVGIIIYTIYKTCLTSPQYQFSSTNDDDSPYNNHDQNGGGGGWFRNTFGHNPGGAAPPPYGFRQEHYNAGCGGGQPQNRRNNFGGFWTGAATGGLLGYMFGNRNQRAGYNQGYHWPQSGWSAFNNNSTSRGSGGSSSSFSNSSDSGTRTASGFGGTRRR